MSGWPVRVDRSQLRVEYYRGSGAGGQKRNKTSSACRITYLPTGLQASCEDHREQGRNRSIAFCRLADQLVPLMLQATSPNIQVERPSVEMVRDYSWQRSSVRDRRVRGRTWPLGAFMDGKLLGEVWRRIAGK